MSNKDRINRHPAGTPSGGRFAPGARPETKARLDPADAGTPAPMIDVLDAEHDQLWSFIEHPDPVVRAEAVRSMLLDGDQIDALMDASRQPLSVRRAVTRLLHCGVAEAASNDPHPLVKLAALDGWDLPPQARERLLADPEVRRAARLFARAGAT